MSVTAIIIATIVVGGTGLFIGVFLGIAGKKFAVEVDEKEVAVRECLPGNNCGGCGFPGCDGLAAAIAKGEAPVGSCPVGGAPVANKIAVIMIYSSSFFVKSVRQKSMQFSMKCSASEIPPISTNDQKTVFGICRMGLEVTSAIILPQPS